MILSFGGCGSSQGSAPATELTIRAVNSDVGRSEFHLTCEPPGGDLPDPVRACAALAKEPELVTAPKRFVCAGGMFSWWDVTILAGKPIHTGGPLNVGYNGANIVGVTMTVERYDDSSVAVDCHTDS
jgi:hypothetical protein